MRQDSALARPEPHEKPLNVGGMRTAPQTYRLSGPNLCLVHRKPTALHAGKGRIASTAMRKGRFAVQSGRGRLWAGPEPRWASLAGATK